MIRTGLLVWGRLRLRSQVTRARRAIVVCWPSLLAIWCGGLQAATPAAASSWSAALTLNPQAVPIEALQAVACPTTTQCTAIDQWGEITFTPGSARPSPAATIDPGVALAGVGCSSTTQCVAIDRNGQAVTFDPGSPGLPTPVQIAAHSLTAVACPSSGQCTATDSSGLEITFDPRVPGTRRSAPLGSTFPVSSIACPSAAQCTGVDATGQVITFDPLAPGTIAPVRVATWIPGTGPGFSVACPSTTQCTVVNGAIEATFDPHAPAGSASSNVPGAEGMGAGIACPAANQCTAVGNVRSAGEVTFDPQRPGAVIAGPTTVIQQDAWAASLDGVACPSSVQCTAIDLYNGRETTFNPTASGSASAPQFVDTSSGPDHIGCLPAGPCVVVSSGEAGPERNGRANTPQGEEIILDPTGIAAPVVTPLAELSAPWGVACVAQTRCLTTDNNGQLLALDPTMPGSSTPGLFFRGFNNAFFTALACSSSSQCTAVDGGGQAVTFDPRTLVVPATATQIDPSLSYRGSVLALACPSARQCTAVDSSGGAATFDPRTPGKPRVVTIDRGVALLSVACPATHACVAVDATGNAVAFDPAALRGSRTFVVDPRSSLRSVACPERARCVAVDSAGRAVEGNPQRPGSWSVEPISGANELVSVACTTATLCVAVDVVGNVFVSGGPATRHVSKSARGPRISGAPIRGATLQANIGLWTNAPMGYLFVWTRCTHKGRVCRVVAGAIGATYALTAADVGFAIQVQVSAANSAGTSTPVTSRATAIVRRPRRHH